MDQRDAKALEEAVQQEAVFIKTFFDEIEQVVIGQRRLVACFLTGLLANGHILIEGMPGLAKTLAVKTFAHTMRAVFKRIQFTPDMLPMDLTGGPVYNQATGGFFLRKGPVFTNILLADEINRAPAKVQSALLEVMQERQVTIGEETFDLEEPFMVLATQNPIEQDGTFPLPESQLDRFMIHARVSYPSRDEEARILKTMSSTQKRATPAPVIDPVHVLRMQRLVDRVYMAPPVEDYLLDIVEATRDPARFGMPDLAPLIRFGVSPRATIQLTLAAKAHAFIKGRAFVRPYDVKEMASDVLRHRIIESYEATSRHIRTEEILQQILDGVPMP